MKKTIAMTMIAVLACLSIAGCSSSGNGNSASAGNASASDSSATAQIETVEKTEATEKAKETEGAETAEGTAEAETNASASQEPAGDMVEIPDFTGENGLIAAEKAFKLELIPVLKSDNGKTVINPLNWQVIGQEPVPGETAEKNSLIVLTVTKGDGGDDVSGGGESVAVVPFVVGMNAANAEKQLENVGLKVNIESDNGKMVLKKKNWRVVSQSLEDGTVVKKGAEVTLIVSKGD